MDPEVGSVLTSSGKHVPPASGKRSMETNCALPAGCCQTDEPVPRQTTTIKTATIASAPLLLLLRMSLLRTSESLQRSVESKTRKMYPLGFYGGHFHIRYFFVNRFVTQPSSVGAGMLGCRVIICDSAWICGKVTE